MLLNYLIGRLVLSSLCVGDLVWLVLSSARVAGWWWWTLVNVVMNLQVPLNAGNVAFFLPGRAKDLQHPYRWEWSYFSSCFMSYNCDTTSEISKFI